MKYLFTISIIILTSCISLKNTSNELVGKWECYHKELEDGTTKSTDLFSGEEFEYSCDGLIIELKSDFTGSESIGEDSFEYKKTDNYEKDSYNLTLEINKQLEKMILKKPEQWLWTHNRWK